MKTYRSERKGRRTFDTALEYDTARMMVSEKTRTTKPVVRATCLLAEGVVMRDFKLKPWNRGISDSDLLDDMRRVAKLLGKTTLRYNEYPKHGRCASRIFESRFGSWNAALRAAGLEVGRRQDIPEEELFENMERVWTALGRQPRREEIKKPLSLFSRGTYERRFGGWRHALERFVKYANSDEPATTPVRSLGAVGASPRFPDLRMRWRVLTRDSFRCRSCGRSPAIEFGVVLHVDHIDPWSKGGRTHDENLQTLCDRCNLGKGDVVPGEV